MEDLSEKLNKVLSDPESMNMINSLLGSLGKKDEKPEEEHQKEDDSTKESLLPDGSLELMLKFAPLLSSFNEENESTRLLTALRPYLKEERKKRLDEAKKILQIIKLLPLIKETGLF